MKFKSISISQSQKSYLGTIVSLKTRKEKSQVSCRRAAKFALSRYSIVVRLDLLSRCPRPPPGDALGSDLELLAVARLATGVSVDSTSINRWPRYQVSLTPARP